MVSLLTRFLPLLCVVAFACTSGDSSAADTTSVLPFDRARVRLVHGTDTLRLTLELAVSEEQRTLGLMERRQLADGAGMLFLYTTTQPDSSGFWMYRTRIPLDIAFFDSTGLIRSILHMVPCTTTLPQGCPTYAPGVPYRGALEVNAGYFAKHHVVPGDRLLLADTSARIPKAGRGRGAS